MKRRQFSGALLAAGAGMATGAAAPRARSVFGGVEVGVQSYTFRAFTIDRMIATLRELGLASLELWNGHLDPAKASPAEFKAVRGQLDRAGIAVSAYCANFPTDATDDHLERAFRGARLLGARVMTSSFEKPLLARVDERCRRHRMRLGIHNHWLGDSWFKGDKAINFEGPADFLDALKGRSPYLGINLDIGHFSAAGHDAAAFFREHHGRVFSLHVKDRGADAGHSYTRFGQGATPIAEVLKLARAVRFPYAANIEWELDEQDPTAGVRDSLDYMKRVLTAP